MEISFKTTNNIWKVKLEKFTLSGVWMENNGSVNIEGD